MRALRFLLKKEFTQIFRDHVIVRILFIMPIAQLLLLANAATFEVKSGRMFVVDRDRSTMSRDVIARLQSSGRFVGAASSLSMDAANHAMLNREIDVIVVIPADFERDMVRERRAPVQLIFNAEDGAAAAVMQSYANQILANYTTELIPRLLPAAQSVLQRGTPSRGNAVIDLRQRGWYNTERDYRDYMVPGILVVLVTIIGTLLTAMNIVREKEVGTLEQLNVTPLKRATFIAAKLIPLWSLALVIMGVGLALAHFAFGVPVRGSLWLVFLSTAIYLVGALGIGLWVSTVAETQQQAMFVTYAIMLVYLLMSGLLTPVRGMPEWAQWVARGSPVMHFAELLRAVLLKGAGLTDVARQLLVLTVMGIAVLSFSVGLYRKQTK